MLPYKRHMNGHGTMLSESLLPGRDLGAAREAFVTRDAEASRTAHETTEAPELHQTGGEHVKTIVFGGLDGILTAHAVIAAAVGAKLAPGHVLALGVSNVLADALSMGHPASVPGAGPRAAKAALAEMADRTKAGQWAPDLDAVLP